MGGVMCYDNIEGKTSKKTVAAIREPDQDNPTKLMYTPTYYTNPERKDEDFTFNDKLRLQSVNKVADNSNSNAKQSSDDHWQTFALMLIEEINAINTDTEWNSNSIKSGLRVIFSQGEDKIYFGVKPTNHKSISSTIITIGPSGTSNGHQTTTKASQLSYGNSSIPANFGPQLVSNPDISRNPSGFNEKQSIFQDQQGSLSVVTIKLEFEVPCSAEKLLSGIKRVKLHTNRVEEQLYVKSSPEKEFCIQHITMAKQIAKGKSELLLANYSTDIGQNLNSCFASVLHQDVPISPNIEREHIIKAGLTFIEKYESMNEQNRVTSSFRGNQAEQLKGSTFKNEENGAAGNATQQNPFGSMNLNIGSIRTKIRFFGEFLHQEAQEESVLQMVFLTQCREYIDICRKIAISDAGSDISSESAERISEFKRREAEEHKSNLTQQQM